MSTQWTRDLWSKGKLQTLHPASHDGGRCPSPHTLEGSSIGAVCMLLDAAQLPVLTHAAGQTHVDFNLRCFVTNLLALLFLVQSDLNETQRERLVSALTNQGYRIETYTYPVVRQTMFDQFAATRAGKLVCKIPIFGTLLTRKTAMEGERKVLQVLLVTLTCARVQ